MTGTKRAGAALALLVAAAPSAGLAQAGCVTVTLSEPPPTRLVLRCADGLTLTAERGAAFRLIDRNRDGQPEAVLLTDRALLVDRPPGSRRGFQVLTPHAIASVRGTQWAVDVTAVRTSVFVESGAVSVRRPRGAAVTLSPGEGVDVEAGTTRLEVKRWGAPRVAALLARLRP